MAQPGPSGNNGAHGGKGRKKGRKQKQKQESPTVTQISDQAVVVTQGDWTVIMMPKAKGDPEAKWFHYIDDHYPHLLTQTHFYPPFHFNRSPYTIVTVIGQRAHLPGNPCLSPAPAHYIHVPDSEQQDNRAQERCLSVLSSIPKQVMMVLSMLKLKDYLNEYDAPGIRLPTIRDPSLPQGLQDSQWDILLIHRHNGLLMGEVRSVGGSSGFHQQSPDEQTSVIKEDLKKALKLLQNQDTALRHLVNDLPPVRVIRTLLFPHITARQLRSAVQSDSSLQKKLCQVLGLNDVNMALGLCLCEEDAADPSNWWQRLFSAGTDPTMTEGIFKRLVARFCGPATVIQIPSLGPSSKVLRSWGDAVVETGWRLAMLRMTPSIQELIQREPEPQHLYLQGPAGTGKAICLFMKALQWAQQGRRVVCMSGSDSSRAQTFLLKNTISKKAPVEDDDSIQQAELGLQEEGMDIGAAVSALQKQMGPGPFSVFVLAVGSYRERFLQWLIEVHDRLPDVTVWACGVYRVDKGLSGQPLPSWLEVQTTQEALRCPPTVTTHLQRLNELQDKDILPYIVPQHSLITQGPPVQQLQHRGQPGHSGDHPWQCEACGDIVYDIIKNQLHVGQTGHSLQYRDIFFLYADGDTLPRADDVMVRQLQRHGVPTRAVTSHPLSDGDTKDLAEAVKDVSTAVSWRSVQALERRVVVALDTERGGERSDFSLSNTCLCIGALYTID